MRCRTRADTRDADSVQQATNNSRLKRNKLEHITNTLRTQKESKYLSFAERHFGQLSIERTESEKQSPLSLNVYHFQKYQIHWGQLIVNSLFENKRACGQQRMHTSSIVLWKGNDREQEDLLADFFFLFTKFNTDTNCSSSSSLNALPYSHTDSKPSRTIRIWSILSI